MVTRKRCVSSRCVGKEGGRLRPRRLRAMCARFDTGFPPARVGVDHALSSVSGFKKRARRTLDEGRGGGVSVRAFAPPWSRWPPRCLSRGDVIPLGGYPLLLAGFNPVPIISVFPVNHFCSSYFAGQCSIRRRWKCESPRLSFRQSHLLVAGEAINHESSVWQPRRRADCFVHTLGRPTDAVRC